MISTEEEHIIRNLNSDVKDYNENLENLLEDLQTSLSTTEKHNTSYTTYSTAPRQYVKETQQQNVKIITRRSDEGREFLPYDDYNNFSVRSSKSTEQRGRSYEVNNLGSLPRDGTLIKEVKLLHNTPSETRSKDIILSSNQSYNEDKNIVLQEDTRNLALSQNILLPQPGTKVTTTVKTYTYEIPQDVNYIQGTQTLQYSEPRKVILSEEKSRDIHYNEPRTILLEEKNREVHYNEPRTILLEEKNREVHYNEPRKIILSEEKNRDYSEEHNRDVYKNRVIYKTIEERTDHKQHICPPGGNIPTGGACPYCDSHNIPNVCTYCKGHNITSICSYCNTHTTTNVCTNCKINNITNVCSYCNSNNTLTHHVCPHCKGNNVYVTEPDSPRQNVPRNDKYIINKHETNTIYNTSSYPAHNNRPYPYEPANTPRNKRDTNRSPEPVGFPRESFPVDNIDTGNHPPKHVDDLMATLQVSNRDAYNDNITPRKETDTSLATSKDLQVPSKNIAGPPIYYPPGKENFTMKQSQSSSASGGGGKWAKASGAYEYSAESKSKSSSKTSGAVVPVCLPLCCAMPCAIM